MRKSGNEETKQSGQERAECVQESGSRVKNSHPTQRWPGAPEGILHWYGKMKGGSGGPPPENFEI